MGYEKDDETGDMKVWREKLYAPDRDITETYHPEMKKAMVFIFNKMDELVKSTYRFPMEIWNAYHHPDCDCMREEDFEKLMIEAGIPEPYMFPDKVVGYF